MREELGPSVVPKSIQDAHEAEMIFLAVPFSAHKAIAKQLEEWNGIELGRLDQGGAPLHVLSGRPGGLLFQNLVKLG